MIRRAVAWLLAEIATPTVGQLADRLELAEGAAARDAAQIESLQEDLAYNKSARFALVAKLAEACAERDRLMDQRLAEACMDRDDAMAFANISGEILTRRTEALRRIAARVTASPNAASRDMARIAREALE